MKKYKVSYADNQKHLSQIFDAIIKKMSEFNQLSSNVIFDNVSYYIKLLHKKDINEANEKYIYDTFNNHVCFVKKCDHNLDYIIERIEVFL